MSGRSSLWEGSKRSVSNAGFELVLSEMRVRREAWGLFSFVTS